MAGSAFLSQSSSFHPAVGSQAPFHMKQSAHSFERDATTKPIGTPFGNTPSPPGASSVLIRRLPLNTSEEQLRLMAVWSKELMSVEVLPIEQSGDSGFRSAIMNFKTPAGALEAKSMLDGKSNIANDAEMIVEILSDAALSASSTASSSAASSIVNSRQTSRFIPGGATPERSRCLRRKWRDGAKESDCSSDSHFSHGRSFPQYNRIRPFFSPAVRASRYRQHPNTPQRHVTPDGDWPRATHELPSKFALSKTQFSSPVNPADQNPPCNTLYVGNLPIDTSEEELKAIFSKQRGYKRLCFRTKQNGPMCFVEFEDVSFATKALHELYGQPLHNSVKGGIRLSFSKNP
ncbi:unnamed protein product [Parascedosporium putredinis]|uniref:RRM domain-containing protein n=1 Tax=Parascedosporium putredinis TaxID=1442378 RepID=A0A9P1H7E3_9PEZI|nr:unnamed protein product [Parascedosporium putredinis]CAI8001329.1 unnamed protein product [Parascedosporium putredinis]